MFKFSFVLSYNWEGTAELTPIAEELGFSADQIIDGLQSGELHFCPIIGDAFAEIKKEDTCLAIVQTASQKNPSAWYSEFIVE